MSAMPERDDAPTQPLPPVATRTPTRRTPLRPLAGSGAAASLFGAVLLAAEYAPAANAAPRLVRGAVWALAAGFLFLGLGALAWTVILILVNAVTHTARECQRAGRERRRALFTSGGADLARQRAEYWSVAERAAGVQRPPRDATILDMASSRRWGGPGARRGAGD